MSNLDFTIDTLGPATIPSPLKLSYKKNDKIADFVSNNDKIYYHCETDVDRISPYSDDMATIELAGPRSKIYFDPRKVRAAIVTCGGLCPGLNNVIRAVLMTLWHNYGVRDILGIRFGYRGLLPQYNLEPMILTPSIVKDIHHKGGTILGSSRGHGDKTVEMADTLEKLGINMLFTIGGDGTQKGALAISDELKSRGSNCSVIGIPKTIDNDLSFVERTFGFATAVSQAVESVSGAHTEAEDAINGIGLVKLMGRESGFIAAATALAMTDVNFVLIPEMPFALEGPNGLLSALKDRLARRGHAVIVVAEGAGQDLIQAEGTDASGNKKLGDIGLLLKDKIGEHLKNANIDHSIKYIDPSYIIRSTNTTPSDSIYCAQLGANAAHAGMAGKTGLLISSIHNRLVHVPISLSVEKRNVVDLDGPLWRDVILATGQPYILS